LEALVEALARAADSDAVDNEPKRASDTDAELLRDAFVTFSHQSDFQAGHDRPRKGRLFDPAQRAATGFSSYWNCAMMNRCWKRVT